MSAQEYEPRQELSGDKVDVFPLTDLNTTREAQSTYRLVVKFRDAHLARALEGGDVEFMGVGSASDVRPVARIHGVRFEPLFRTAPEVLEDLCERAMLRSGKEQADLGGFLIAEVNWRTLADLHDVGEELLYLDEIEAVAIESHESAFPGDQHPPTPYLGGYQSYRGPNPGLDFDYAWALSARCGGVRFSDIEFNWLSTHEHFGGVDLHPEPGQTPRADPNGYDADHGAGVLGLAVADVDGYGIDGVVNAATFYTYPAESIEDSLRIPTALANACNASNSGDVFLLEQQTFG